MLYLGISPVCCTLYYFVLLVVIAAVTGAYHAHRSGVGMEGIKALTRLVFRESIARAVYAWKILTSKS